MSAPGQVSDYRLVQKLAEDALGARYLGSDARGGTAAVWLLRGSPDALREAVTRLLEQSRALVALDHPHILAGYEVADVADGALIALPLPEGESLAQLLRRGALDEPRAARILHALAAALGTAHAHGIVHGAVSSDHVFLGADGRVALTGFGIVTLVESLQPVGLSVLMGSFHHVAPERVRGLACGPAADQFSLAALTHECLTGAPPFRAATLAGLFQAVVSQPAEPPSALRPELQPAWDAVLARGLSKDPGQRFPTLSDFASAAQAVLQRSTAVAVLPFEDLAGDFEGDCLSAGLAEDVLASLGRLGAFRVIPWKAAAAYRGLPIDPVGAVAELNARAVLAGSLLRVGNRVALNLRLTGAAGALLWSQRYDSTLSDVFAMHDEIVHEVAKALGVAPSAMQIAELGRGRAARAEAYECFLQGRELTRRDPPEDHRRALECFEQAVRLDPGYAAAWAALASGCARHGERGWDRSQNLAARGVEAAERAVALDPAQIEGYEALARLWSARGDAARAGEALRRAMAIDPTRVNALATLVRDLLVQGDFAGAERWVRQSLRADPTHGVCRVLLGGVLLATRRYAEVLEATPVPRTGGGRLDGTACALRIHACLLAADPAGAAREIVRGREAGVADGVLRAGEALIAARTGRTERGLALLESLEQDPPVDHQACEMAAAAAATLGRPAAATVFLAAAEGSDPRPIAWWRISPDFRPLRKDRDLRGLLRERGRRVVWPTEATPLLPEERQQFREVLTASGQPNDPAA